MTADQYLQQVLAGITAPTGLAGPGNAVHAALYPTISAWAGTQLNQVSLSGSYAKNTAVVGDTDVDLFISLKSDTGGTLAEIYSSLATKMTQAGYTVRRQNVSIGITHAGYKVDLVPGRRQQGFLTTDHSIYVSRGDTWKQTNIETHIQTIRGSSHLGVIRLMKRWRDVHQLEFLSFALELSVLRALQGQLLSLFSIAVSMRTCLEWLRDNILTAQLLDPANSNNNLASELTTAEKTAIRAHAISSLGQQYWESIVW